MRKTAPMAHRRLSFAGVRFHGLGCGKFPVSVWLGARGARIQLARLLGGGATGRTKHREDLFHREFLGFHIPIMHPFEDGEWSLLLTLDSFRRERLEGNGMPASGHRDGFCIL